MQTRVLKGEQGLLVVIPNELAERAGLVPGGLADVEARFGGLLIYSEERKPPSIEEIVAGMTDDKLHGPDEGLYPEPEAAP